MRKFDSIQPICDHCYESKYSRQAPIINIAIIEVELCCECGEQTPGGLYVRVDPSKVRFATLMTDQ
jgi:hypothetical protein